MNILEKVLNKINIKKTQAKFIMILIQGLMGALGKKNFKNLSRYCGISQHTFMRQMEKGWDAVEINKEIIKEVPGEKKMAMQDGVFLKKSGKKTPGINNFWNSTESRVEKGLQADLISVAVPTGKNEYDAFALSAKQLTSEYGIRKKDDKKNQLTSVDFSVEHLKIAAPHLHELGVTHMTGDAYCAKKKYVDGVTDCGFFAVSRLRKDANLRVVWTQPKTGNRGRPRKYGNRISSQDFDQGETVVFKLEDSSEEIILQSCFAYHMSLQRVIKVVRVSRKDHPDRFLFSTDLTQPSKEIYEFYTARFQIEFLFRDAKQSTGFQHFQTRNSQRIHSHLNASLLAVNVAKFHELEFQKTQNISRPFSMSSYTCEKSLEIISNRFISMLDLDPTLIKNHPNYKPFLNSGSLYV